MTEVRLKIYTRAVAWQRPRSRGRKGGFFTAPNQREFQALIKKAWDILYPDTEPSHDAISMSITFHMHRPKHKIWKKKEMPSYPHTSPPDLDNLAKAVIDALQGRAYVDDKQVFELYCRKIVHRGDEVPMVDIIIGGQVL